MKPNDDTLYEKNEQVASKSQVDNKSGAAIDKKDDSNFAKRAMLLGGAILAGGTLGGGLAYATSGHASDNAEESSVFEIIDESDDKSFEDAFNDAREQLGPGAAFRWHGGVYSTYTKEEWESMSEEERQSFNDKVKPLMTPDDADPNNYRGTSGVETSQSTTADTRDPHHDSAIHKASVVHHDNYEITREETTTLQGKQVIMAEGMHNGQSAVFIDVDKDGRYDIMVEDANQDGKLSEDEYIDISKENITVHNKALMGMQPVTDEFTIIEEAETEIDGQRVIIARAEHNGEKAVLIDTDRDGKYDVSIEDTNHDNQLTTDDYHDISNYNISVQDTSLMNGGNNNTSETSEELTVDVDYGTERIEDDVIDALGTVNGHRAVIIDANRDGIYDAAIVDQNDNGALDENERSPVNIVSTNTRVHNTSLIDNNTTDVNLDHQDDNAPDYVNTLASNNGTEAEVEVTVDVPETESPEYTASVSGEDTTAVDDAATQYNNMAFNGTSDPVCETDMMTDDYASQS